MKKINYLWSLVMAALVVLSSCSSEPSLDDMLKVIPDDAAMVARLNVASLLDNAGMKRDGDKFLMSDDIESIINGLPGDVQEQFEQLLEAIPAIDIENIIFYATSFDGDDDIAFIVGLKKASEIESYFKKEFGAPEKKDDYNIYDAGTGLWFVIKDNMLWMTPDTKTLIKNIKRTQDGENFTANIGPAEYLAGSPTFAAVVNVKKIADEMNAREREMLENYRKSYICFAATLDGPALTGALTMMNKDGKTTFPGDMAGEINTAVLRYVPENAMFAMAIGKPSSALLDALDAESHYRRDARAAQYLDGVEGTTMVAIVPPSSAEDMLNYTKWNFIFSVDMEQSLVDELVTRLASEPGYYMTSESLGDNMYKVHNVYGNTVFGFGGPDVYFGNNSGNFVLSTMPIRTDCNNSFTTAFSGKRGAAVASVASNNALLKELKLNLGLNVVANYENDGCKLTIKLTNTDKNLLEELISLASNERWQREVTSVLLEIFGSGKAYTTSDYSYDDWDVPVEVEEATEWEEAEAVDYGDW